MQNKIGKLSIVSTPIGNLGDITLRAIETLKAVDLIICEDSRITNRLLKHLLIEKTLFIYNDHSDETARDKIIDKLNQGLNIALVSDAGTPLISDPGYKLVLELNKQGIEVDVVPGACSPIAALCISGIPSDRFMFTGFIPSKDSAKEKLFEELKTYKTSLIFFESAQRLENTLSMMKKFFSARKVAVIKELTKLYQQAINASIDEIIDYFEKNPDKLKGEIIIIVAPPNENEGLNFDDIEAELSTLLNSMSVKDAVELVSRNNELPKKQIYKLALSLKSK